MTTLRPYPAYKDSGIDWLGDVPEHWECLPNRALFTEVIEKNHPNEPMLSVTIQRGVITQEELLQDSSRKDSSNPDKSSYKLVNIGDLAYNKMRAWQGAVGVSGYRGIVSPAYIIMRPRQGQHPRYLHYLFKTPSFATEAERWSYGITSDQWSLRSEDFKQIYSLNPPLDEQRAIADFLDAMDARITRFLAARRRMIALLEEQKQAVINQAVTRGLDPDVPLKDSGVDWLGKIPTHWETGRIRRCVENPVAGIWGEEPSDENSEDHIWCVRVADFDMPTLRVSDAKKTIRAVPETARRPRLLIEGDILMEKSGGGDNQPVGRAVIYDWPEPALTSNFVTRLRPDHTIILPHFLLYVLETLQASRLTQLSIKQTTGIQNLDERHYLSNSIPLPRLDEQQAIVDHIDRETSRIDALIDRHRREIDLMQEYRTRLISDVVTGKLDVRGVELPPVEAVISEEIEAAMEEAPIPS